MAAERLQKVMAAAGVGSRRLCETLIAEGRVQVNGKVVTELGAKADPARDRIVVDGKLLAFTKQHVYYKVHKPRGVISDIGGEEIDLRTGEPRKTVADLLPPDHPRVFPVGRLDLHSEGLVLLTDDGELANRLTHPRYQHPKTYYVLLGEQPSQEALVRLRNGVDLPEGRTAPAEVMIVSHLPATLRLSKGPSEGVWLRIVLREGKKRQIRHMTAAVGYPALRLLRWSIGPLTLGKLELGQAVALTLDEINSLRHLAGLPPFTAPKASRDAAPGRAGGARGAAERSGGRRNSPGQREPRRTGSRGPGARKIRLQPAGEEGAKPQGRSPQGRAAQGPAESPASRAASEGPRKPTSLKLRKAAPSGPRKAAAPGIARRGGQQGSRRQGSRRQGSGRQGDGRAPRQGGQRG